MKSARCGNENKVETYLARNLDFRKPMDAGRWEHLKAQLAKVQNDGHIYVESRESWRNILPSNGFVKGKRIA